MYKPVKGDIYAVATNADAAADAAAVDAARDAAATIPYDPSEEFFKNIREDKSYWSSNENWKSDVRKFRLDMKRAFDSNTKLDTCHKACLDYLPFDMVYPFKSVQLNAEIKKICDLTGTAVPVDKLDIGERRRTTYFKYPYDHHKTTTSYLYLVDSIKTNHSVILAPKSFANCLNDLFLKPKGDLLLNGNNYLTLDQLIECMDLLTTPIATSDIIHSIAAYPNLVLSGHTQRNSYDKMIDNFTKLLYDMSQNFKKTFNTDLLVHFPHHNKIYNELKLYF